MSSFYEAAWRLTRAIPAGRVMTYGQIATILGAPRGARAVGYAMLASGGEGDVPWQRVLNRNGGISTGGEAERPLLQRKLLEEEGIVFDGQGCCDLRRYRWDPPNPDAYFFQTSTEFPFR